MHHLKISFRSLRRNIWYSLISILGLAIGFTATLFIFVYVWQESHYDNFHQCESSLFRVSVSMAQAGLSGRSSELVAPIGPAMKAEIPEVEAFTRLCRAGVFTMVYEQSLLKRENIYFADTSFLQLFNFPLKRGDVKTALAAPFSIVLTEETAAALFGNEDPIGKIITVNEEMQYAVAGVVAAPPQNSQFRFNALVSFSTLYRFPNRYMDWRGGNQYTAYVLLHEQAQRSLAESKLDNLLHKYLGEDIEAAKATIKGNLEPIRDVHLFYTHDSLRMSLYILSGIALLTLVVACINFVNLTIARSLRRIREAAIYKVMGAKKAALRRRFLSESIVVAVSAFILSLLLAKLCEPIFFQLTGATLNSVPGTLFLGIVVLLGLSIITGFIGGSYSAFYLSAIPVDTAMKGGKVKYGKRFAQNILLTIQFAISAGLVLCTIFVSQQLNFVHQKELGYQREHILVLPLTGNPTADRYPLLKERLLNLTGIQAVTASSSLPSDWTTMNGYIPEGTNDPLMIHVIDVDEDFLRVYGIQLLEGKFFSKDNFADKEAYVVNEKLVKTLDWNNEAINKYILRNSPHPVIGIVRDFHYNPLYTAIGPLIITNSPWNNRYKEVSVKFETSDIPTLIKAVQATWSEVNPHSPFEYKFFDDVFNNTYKLVQDFRSLFSTFAIVSIILALVGMLSLLSYTIEQRRKEIAIRRIQGASVSDIWRLLTQKMVIIISIGNLLICPVVWFVMEQLLGYFAYRITMGWGVFVLTWLCSLLFTLAALSFQLFRAVQSNPAEVIKIE